MKDKACSLYRMEKVTGIHRQSIHGFLKGSGLTYENGMKMRKFMKSEEIKVKEEEHEPNCIHYPCTCSGKK